MRSFVLSAAVAALLTTPAAAQGPAPLRTGYVNINLGGQAKSSDFRETSTFPVYDEIATFGVEHDIGGGGLFDITAGVRVWRNVSVGGAFATRFKSNRNASVEASIPHPAFHDAFRAATAPVSLGYSERAVHLHALWAMPITEEFDLGIFFGPSFFTVKEDLLQGVSFSEGPDFSTVTLTGVERRRVSEGAAGFNIGVDGTYMLTHRIGGGAMLRFSRGTADLPLAGGGTADVDAGGFDVAVGVRFRF